MGLCHGNILLGDSLHPCMFSRMGEMQDEVCSLYEPELLGLDQEDPIHEL